MSQCNHTSYIVNIVCVEHWSLSFIFSVVMCELVLFFWSKIWLHWKEMHVAACCQKEKESKAALHFILRLKRKTLHCWESYVARLQTKKKSQGHYKLPVTYLFNINHKLSHTLALVHILKPQFLFFFSSGSACVPSPTDEDVLE